MPSNYKRPPIIEAVIEIRVSEPSDQKTLDRLQKRLQDRYPAPPQITANVNFEITDKGANIRHDNKGFKILSSDGTYAVSVSPISVSTSSTPPYAGWEIFTAEMRRNWEDWRRIVGWKPVARLGVRYINRIDIPSPESGAIPLEEFFVFGVRVPEVPHLFGNISQFGANAEMSLAISPFKLTLNTGPTASPLVKTASFLLDLDLSIDQDMPNSDESLWLAIERFRDLKNAVFEACITDKTRSLLS